ncbi:hypothetical protein H0H92_005416, partial [Tricholoma furcatifolium]
LRAMPQGGLYNLPILFALEGLRMTSATDRLVVPRTPDLPEVILDALPQFLVFPVFGVLVV